MNEPAISAAANEDTDHCEVCSKLLKNCYTVITITLDRERAIRVYKYLFKKHYRYCSLEHAAAFYECWPTLAKDYLTVTAGDFAPITAGDLITVTETQ